jgi:glucose-6-phosphate 1-dehydrogenase
MGDNGPEVFVIFGGSGDLAGREIVPAVHSLMRAGEFSSGLRVIGVADDAFDDDTYREMLSDWIIRTPWLRPGFRARWKDSAPSFSYVRGDLRAKETYLSVARRIGEGEDIGALRCLFHLAVPPDLFGTILRHMKATRLNLEAPGWKRVIIEKPFGHDLRSSRALERQVQASLRQRQVFRMDHYLGRESVGNIVALRSTNPMLESVWDRRSVDHVQITMAETLGLEGRARYYDGTGVLRDMVQNHLFQLLALTAMGLPASADGKGINRAKEAVLESVVPIRVDDVVLGQYDGYGGEAGATEGSTTPTYAALRVWVDNRRWSGVPFYLRTGKRMARKLTEVVLVYRERAHLPESGIRGASPGDCLSIGIQPDDRVRFWFNAPLSASGRGKTPKELHLERSRSGGRHLEAYERLLLAAARDDHAPFVSFRFEELAWSKIDSLLRRTEGEPVLPKPYRQGSWGPREAESLLELDGRRWHPESLTSAS